jgi:hypothetical protein
MVMPTLPAFPAVDDLSERVHLLAGLTFVEGATSWDAADLALWFHTYAEVLGCEAIPPTVQVSLGAGPSRLIALARWQVILTMRGLLSAPADDRFLHAAIYARRVVRAGGAWRCETHDGEPLADIVLALFAADILTHREFHEERLCVCDVCGRLSYHPTLTTRAGCPDHVPSGDAAREGDEPRWASSGR